MNSFYAYAYQNQGSSNPEPFSLENEVDFKSIANPAPSALISTTRNQRLIGIALLVMLTVYFMIKGMAYFILPSNSTAMISVSNLKTETFSALEDDKKRALFDEFHTTYNKNYKNVEDIKHRFQIFKDNLAKIDHLNAHSENAEFHISKFCDLTEEEFKQVNSLDTDYLEILKHILEQSDDEKRNIGFSSYFNVDSESEPSGLQLNTHFDWRTMGAVTAVKDQGSCGSSWAFSVTGNIEGVWFVNSGNAQLLSLSAQQLISCASTENGCSGGMMSDGFTYVQKSGIQSENTFPYTSASGEKGKCPVSGSSIAEISGWTLCTSDSVPALQSIVRSHGPLSVAINADQLQFYLTGIVSCSAANTLNHALLLVGFGQQQGESYWILKNSWGPTWGQGGYLYLSTENDCGVSTMPMTAFFNTQ